MTNTNPASTNMINKRYDKMIPIPLWRNLFSKNSISHSMARATINAVNIKKRISMVLKMKYARNMATIPMSQNLSDVLLVNIHPHDA